MKSLFKVTVEQSLQLVLEQVKLIKKKRSTPIKTIILCGGLGSSPYLKYKFDEFCEETFGGKIKVVRPMRPWSSVCRGAALRGLEGCPIISRRSRQYIGFVVHVEFEDDEHDEKDAWEDPIDGEKRALNQMMWVVRKVRLERTSIVLTASANWERTRNSNRVSKGSTAVDTLSVPKCRATLVAKSSTSARWIVRQLVLILMVGYL